MSMNDMAGHSTYIVSGRVVSSMAYYAARGPHEVLQTPVCLCLSLRPSVTCIRFSRSRKAIETSNLVKTVPDKSY